MKNVLITGTFRSGTSLLTTVLSAHKQVAIAWQPYWSFFKACRNKFFKEIIRKPFDPDYPMGILQFAPGKERALLPDIFNLVKFDRPELMSAISQIKSDLSYEDEKMNRDMKPAGLGKYLDDVEPGTAGDVLSQLMERLYLYEIGTNRANKADLKIVGIKEVFCEEYMEPILAYQGLDSVVLHIIRDPRGVVASRNYGKYMEATGSKYPIFFIIRSWRRTVANYILNKDKKNYLMIKYEDLVSQPEKILNKVCNLSGVPFSEDILDLDKFRDSVGNRWTPNTSFESSKTINTASINRWNSVLSSEEIEVIEYFCQSELRLLRYEIMTKYFDVERISNFHEDMANIKHWLRQYDFREDVKKTRVMVRTE